MSKKLPVQIDSLFADAPDYSAEQIQIIIEKASNGCSVADIVDAINSTMLEYQKFMNSNPEFKAKVSAIRSDALDNLAETLLIIPDEVADVHRARLKSDNIKWILSKRRPEVYGDRIEVNVNQTVDITSALMEAKSRTRDVIALPTETNQLNSSTPETDNDTE